MNNNKLGVGFNSPFVTVPAEIIVKDAAPTGHNYTIGQIWINTSTNTVSMFTGITRNQGAITGNWVTLGSGTSSSSSSSSASAVALEPAVLEDPKPLKKEEQKTPKEEGKK